MLVESMFFQEQQKSAYIKKEGKTERKNIDLLARPTHGVGLKHKFKPIIPASLPMRISA